MSKRPLTRFTYGTAGDMRGSTYSEDITPYDDTRALLTVRSKEYYAADEIVERYLLDAAVLPELERVFRSRGMRLWQHRRIGRMFIADGASKSYSFRFGNGKVFSFSAQYYPGLYGLGVRALRSTVRKYTKEKIPLPEDIGPEELPNAGDLPGESPLIELTRKAENNE